MSYYYNYYIGYRDKNNGKFYPLGPFTIKHKLKPVITRSRSFASNLHENFYVINSTNLSSELREQFEYEDYKGEIICNVKYLPIDKLPSESYIKKGYCLIRDIRRYEKEKQEKGEYFYFDGFYDVLSPEIYAAKLQHELMFGKNQSKKNDKNCYEYIEPNASDYMYYVYPDYYSKEYESFLLSEIVDMLYCDYEDIEYVILETEG